MSPARAQRRRPARAAAFAEYGDAVLALSRQAALAITLAITLAIAVAAPVRRAGGQAPRATQSQVEAVFLFHFTEFVEWPAQAFEGQESRFCIGVLGDDPFGAVLDETMRGEHAAGRPIEVRRFTRIDDAAKCHIIFVGASERARTRAIVTALANRSILTVADADGFARDGGLIQFVVDGGRTRLRINTDAARAAGLTISSKLLRSAEIVSSVR